MSKRNDVYLEPFVSHLGGLGLDSTRDRFSPTQSTAMIRMHPWTTMVALTVQEPAPDLMVNQKPRFPDINMTPKGAIPQASNLNCSQPLDAAPAPSLNPLASQRQQLLSASGLSSHQSESRLFDGLTFCLILLTLLIVCQRFLSTKHHKSSQHSSFARECDDNLMINLRMVGLLCSCLIASCSKLVKQEGTVSSSAEFHSSHCLCLFKCRHTLFTLFIYNLQ